MAGSILHYTCKPVSLNFLYHQYLQSQPYKFPYHRRYNIQTMRYHLYQSLIPDSNILLSGNRAF